MGIERELLREHSKVQALKIAAWVGTDKSRVDELLRLLLHGEPLVTQRAAWVTGIVGCRHPELLQPYLKKVFTKMMRPGVHPAVKRNIVGLLRTMEIPRNLLGTVVTICFDLLSSPDETIAVKASAMTVLARIARKEPDLLNELRSVVAHQLPQSTAAFRACARNHLHLTAEEK
jgi:hypothetical protein